jgi:tetratricopeptide (TPR) repeat protein
MALRGNARAVRNLVIGVALGVAFTGLGVGVWFAVRPVEQSSAELPVVLRSVDRYVADGYLSRAQEELTDASRRARGVAGWLMVLKRAFAISRALGDYQLLYRLARDAVAAVPRNDELRAVAGYAALRTDRLDTAGGFFEGLPADRFAGLLAEHAARDGGTGAQAGLPADTQLLLTLHRQADPEEFIRVAEETGDRRFALDAALRLAGNGRVERAYRVAAERLEPDESRMLLLWLAYDAGDHEAARAHAEAVLQVQGDRADIMLVYADVLRELGEASAAAQVWEQAVRAFPRYSWKPYSGLAALEAREGRRDAALSWINAARGYFPEVEELVVDHAWLLYAADRREEARALLEAYATNHGDAQLAQATLLELFPSHPTPERYRSALWQAFNRYPGNQCIAAALIWYLYGYSDAQGIRTVIDRHAAHGAQTGRLEFQRGALAVLTGKLEEAQSHFQRATESRPQWESQYNLSVVLMMRRQFHGAMEHLREADAMLRGENPSVAAPRRSIVRLQLARCLAAMGNLEAALREVRYALDLDSRNHEARLVAADLQSSLEDAD